MRRFRIGKLLGLILLGYILYAILIGTLVPLLGKSSAAGGRTLPAALSSEKTEAGAGNERVLCIDDNMDALLWRLRVIESARQEIILTTFQLGDDNSGRDLMAALKQAAGRGVQVRILLDGLYAELMLTQSEYFKALAAAENVEIRLYNPISLAKPWMLNYRMHDKYLIADESVYILGGRNSTDLFLGNYQEEQNTDRDVLVYAESAGEGNSIHQVIAYFRQVWELPCNQTAAYNPDHPAIRKAAGELDERFETLHERYADLRKPADWSGETIPVNEVCFLSNPVTAGNKEPVLWKSLCNVMRAGQTILVQTPYIICGDEMYGDLADLTAGARQVRILTNAVENGANPWGCTDYLNQKKNILQAGAEVYEYIGDHSLHAKAILVDDHISLIGSFNMDMRSTYLDTETMLMIDSPQINAHLRQNIQEKTLESRHVMPDGTETKGALFTDRPLGAAGKLYYTLLRILIIPFRHLL